MTEIMPFPENNCETVLLDRAERCASFLLLVYTLDISHRYRYRPELLKYCGLPVFELVDRNSPMDRFVLLFKSAGTVLLKENCCVNRGGTGQIC